MEEELLLAYLEFKGWGVGHTSIELLSDTEGHVNFLSMDEDGRNRKQHIIPLLDILSWVYSINKGESKCL